jgi:hypothetical protein
MLKLKVKPEYRMAEDVPEKEEERRPDTLLEIMNVCQELKQSCPEFYRHLLGIAKAFLKES